MPSGGESGGSAKHPSLPLPLIRNHCTSRYPDGFCRRISPIGGRQRVITVVLDMTDSLMEIARDTCWLLIISGWQTANRENSAVILGRTCWCISSPTGAAEMRATACSCTYTRVRPPNSNLSIAELYKSPSRLRPGELAPSLRLRLQQPCEIS